MSTPWSRHALDQVIADHNSGDWRQFIEEQGRGGDPSAAEVA
jgi:hypothetical protein